MIESIADALFQQSAYPADDVGVEVAANDVTSQRQRQPRALLPPHAQIDDQMQTLVLKGELALVDDEAGVEAAGRHCAEYLVEGEHFMSEVAEQEAQRQEC